MVAPATDISTSTIASASLAPALKEALSFTGATPAGVSPGTASSFTAEPIAIAGRKVSRLLAVRLAVKSAADRLLALTGLLVLLPLLLAVATAVVLTSRGPALFRQRRVGRDGATFTMLKFRTMHLGAEAERGALIELNESGGGVLFKMRDDPRVTPVGRWLRRLSLDELPQLVNVLTGSMSLVGPRPPLPDEVARYGTQARRRLSVKPGLTGLWQVSGRSDLSWDESLSLDLRYVDDWSLSLDAVVLFKTVGAVVRADGAY